MVLPLTLPPDHRRDLWSFLKLASAQLLTKNPWFTLECSLLLTPSGFSLSSSPFDSPSKYSPNMTTPRCLHHYQSSLSHYHLSPALLLPFLVPYILLAIVRSQRNLSKKVNQISGEAVPICPVLSNYHPHLSLYPILLIFRAWTLPTILIYV